MSEIEITEIRRRLDAVETMAQATHDAAIRIEERLKAFQPAGCGDACKMQTDRIASMERRTATIERWMWMGFGVVSAVNLYPVLKQIF